MQIQDNYKLLNAGEKQQIYENLIINKQNIRELLTGLNYYVTANQVDLLEVNLEVASSRVLG